MFTWCCRFGEDFEELMEPWRSHIDEVKLRVVGSKKNDKRLLILLSDHIVLASAHKKPKWKGKLHLAKCWLVDSPDIEGIFFFFFFYIA